ncbi:MAG: polysulfide reductase NrfD [Gammaproteobacteria bacterium]|nr:polysulfide reductase NrfD [Gammaproteobacteria bacterium]
MKKPILREVNESMGFYALLGVFGALILVALGAVYFMEHNGHHVTGMNNQIVWGMPHVFALFLIVAASGALNVASIASVFGRYQYKPLAPLSTVLAAALLLGGLMVLVLDLGRPDRLIVAMTYYNFKSIFAWNIILYNGFLAILVVYLWTQLDPTMVKYGKIAGFAAFIWRLVLTTGTGSIFGFLVARQGYDAAIMAPMFIIMSFAFGLAVFMLVMFAAYKWTNRPLGDGIVRRLKNLLGVFVGAVLYFSLVFHLTNLYATEHHGVEAFILRDGGIFTNLYWWGHFVIGGLLPLFLLYCRKTRDSRTLIGLASLLIILGGIAQLYVIIVGGQAYPLDMFPGMEVSSSFADGVVNNYSPSLAETLLGLGGFAVAMLLVTVVARALRMLPESLADDVVDPHHSKADA